MKKKFIKLHKKFFLCTCCLLTFYSTAFCQCYTTSNLNGNSFANDNSIGSSAFSSLSNAAAEDGSRATASTTLSLLGSAKTNFFKATNFGFSIPETASICGISVRIKKRAIGINILNSVSDEEVRLVIGNTITGNNKADNAAWTNSDTYFSYGGTNDTWGTTITPAEVNSADFGVAIAAVYNGLAGVALSAQIDYITIQVSYSEIIVPLIMGTFTSKIDGNIVSNKWTMYEEEENAIINLQRSVNAGDWKTLNTYKLHNHQGEHDYEFADNLESYGRYFYRLELVGETGGITYSKINTVNFESDLKVIAYPNPSSSIIKLTNVASSDHYLLFNRIGKRIVVPSIYLNGMLQLNIEMLKPGNYFIVIKNKVLSIVKEN